MIKCKIFDENLLRAEESERTCEKQAQRQVKYILSQLRLSKIKKLKKQGIDPENWAAGLFLAFMQDKESASLSKVGK